MNDYKRTEVLSVLHGLVNLHCAKIPADYEHAVMLALNRLATHVENGQELPTFDEIMAMANLRDNAAETAYRIDDVNTEVSRKRQFEQLAQEYYDARKAGRDCERLGHAEQAVIAHGQALGILSAVAALGYSQDDFTAYYNERRKVYRQEG